MAEYDKGQLVRVIGEFLTGYGPYPTSDPSPYFADPGSVVFKFKTPSGAVTTYTFDTDPQLVRVGVGRYYCDVDANASGTWYYRWSSSGSMQGAIEGTFEVRPSQF